MIRFKCKVTFKVSESKFTVPDPKCWNQNDTIYRDIYIYIGYLDSVVPEICLFSPFFLRELIQF